MASPEGALRALVASALLAGVKLPPAREGVGYRAFGLDPGAKGPRPAVVAIGAFDGVHRGHQALIAEARADARRRGLPLVVVTFDPDPALVLGDDRTGRTLLETPERLRALWALGVDGILCLSFDRTLAATGYEEFLTAHLARLVTPRAIHVGENFAMGAGGAGDVRAIAALCAERAIDLVAAPLLILDGAPVSSTRIRHAIAAGDVALATRLLGRAPWVRGTVVHGRGQGARLGFPTANVAIDDTLVAPASGVFAGSVVSGDLAWPAALNFGAPPSFDAQGASAALRLVEAALIGYSGNLYGQTLRVVVGEALRPSVRFEGEGDLAHAVLANIDQTRGLLGDRCQRWA